MQEVYFLFNKTTGAWIGYSFDGKAIASHVLWKKRTVGAEENIANITWEGDYYTGEMVRLSDQAGLVTEYDLEEKLYQRFFRHYGVESIFKNILLQYIKMEQDGTMPMDTLDPEFAAMLKIFKKFYVKYAQEQAFFMKSEDHVYKTKNELDQFIAAQFETDDSKDK